MAKHIDTLMQKEMSRKEFLATMGLGMASVLGFSSIIKLVTGHSLETRFNQKRTSGYGGSAYGN